MKKNYLFVSLLSAVMFAGCSNDESLTGNEGFDGNSGDVRYLSVNIVSTPNNGTRAGSADPGDQNTGDPDNATYENGLQSENTVNTVRFYFFDEDGNAANVKAGSTANYYDWGKPAPDGNDVPNVEKQLKAVLVIDTKAGDKLPAQMVAVINPDETLGNDAVATLTDLRNKVADYAALANATQNPSFVMFNSTYADAAKNEIKATKLTSEYFCTSSEAAEAKPVYVYVERNVAKVRLQHNLADQNGLIKVKDKDGNDITIDEKQIYVKLEGWDVTATLGKAYLGKHIDPNWAADLLGSVQWNWDPYFRSFWADKCAVEGNVNQYFSYDASMTNKHGFILNGSPQNFAYCNENAERAEGVKPTQVIIPATLCDGNGNALTICEYYSEKFVDGVDHANLKKKLLSILTESKNYYKKTMEGETEKYTKISADDITFQTALDAGKIEAGDAGAYYVFATLTDEAKAADWHTSDAKGNTETISATDLQTKVTGLHHAKIWNSGKTYYYFDIEHFGNKAGVVRNHIYDVTLNSLCGLGTPVYKPSETIYPEHPKDEDTYIAAKINILSWRVVTSDIDLVW